MNGETDRFSLPALVLTLVLVLAAAVHLGFLGWIGLDRDDSENLESTLVLLASRQLTGGFAGLYGPYDGDNPGVLIQAPLYYRLTGVLALPFYRLGMDPVDACRWTGRAISATSFLGLLATVGGMGRMWGGSRWGALWAILLVSGTTAIGSFPVSMRADVLGVAFQTLGLALVLSVLGKPSGRRLPRLMGAYAAFALALCTKQHYLAGPTIATLALFAEALRGRLSWLAFVAGPSLAAAILMVYYGGEDILTGGMMHRSVFFLPMELKEVAPGSWSYVGLVFLTAAKHAFGLLVVGAACAAAARRTQIGRLETLLLAFIALDLILMVKLCLNSSGAWYNYAIASAVCGAVLIGRGLGRLAEAERPAWRFAVVLTAALVFLAADVRRVANGVAFRRETRENAATLLNDPAVAGVLPQQRYFSGAIQHYNVLYGDRRLTHDEWLYSAFESIGAAEPRSHWLAEVVGSGQVRLVVLLDGSDEPKGLGAPLTRLGFVPTGQVGPYYLWTRRDAANVAARR